MISDREPRWPAVLAGVAVGGLFTALPPSIAIGPRWLLLVIVVALEIPLYFGRRRDNRGFCRRLGYLLLGVITLFMVMSLALLVHAIPLHKEQPLTMLDSAVALWVTNVLVFASWYWRLDAGGPHQRDLRAVHRDGAFLFPQMTMDAIARAEMGQEDWSPQFVDYLFLAFNTSTALSPADTSALSRWAKILMMLQAAISLTVIALLAARAVNIL